MIGINIDEAARVEQGRKIVAEKNLTWPQVMDGKGEFIPIYQVYGRLPERENSFPAYVVVDRKGISRYATNSFDKMARFLVLELKDESRGDGGDLFCFPLANAMSMRILPSDPLDFSPTNIENFLRISPAELPEILPSSARLGLTSSGTLVAAFPGKTPETLNLIVDSNRDLDLIKEKVEEIPIFKKQDVTSEEAKKIQIITAYESSQNPLSNPLTMNT